MQTLRAVHTVDTVHTAGRLSRARRHALLVITLAVGLAACQDNTPTAPRQIHPPTKPNFTLAPSTSRTRTE